MTGTWQCYEMGEDGFVEESINPARILAAGQESCRGRARGSAGARGKAAGCRRARAVWRRDRARGGCRARAAVGRSGGGGGAADAEGKGEKQGRNNGAGATGFQSFLRVLEYESTSFLI